MLTFQGLKIATHESGIEIDSVIAWCAWCVTFSKIITLMETGRQGT